MLIQDIIQQLGMWIAYAGVAVVVLGVIVTLGRLLHYLFTGFSDERAVSLRHSLMIYLSIGLDFIIAKDVMVTLSLEQAEYQGLIQLGAVIIVRILLSYFVHLEEKVLYLSEVRAKKVKKR